MNVTSYPKVYQLGHRAIKDLFLDEISVEEKIDGSQFSFQVIEIDNEAWATVLKCRSHHQQINLDEVPKMFEDAVCMCPITVDISIFLVALNAGCIPPLAVP